MGYTLPQFYDYRMGKFSKTELWPFRGFIFFFNIASYELKKHYLKHVVREVTAGLQNIKGVLSSNYNILEHYH